MKIFCVDERDQVLLSTTLLVTHDQDEALSTADRIAVLRDGKIAEHATLKYLFTQPVDEKLARFVDEANLIAGTIEDEYVQTPLGKLAARPCRNYRRPSPACPSRC